MPAPDLEAWFWRDLAMTGPRLAGLLACLLISRRARDWNGWGWNSAMTLAGGAALALAGTLEILHRLMGGSEAVFGGARLAAAWLATGPVALFEEAAFRSLLFLSLRERTSPRLAALLSSALFAVYHFEAQPVESWPRIAAFGLAACAALHRGAGLWWLIGVHWLVDGLWFHVGAGAPSDWAFGPARLLFWAVPLASLALLAPVPSRTDP